MRQGPGPQQPLGENVCVEVNSGTDELPLIIIESRSMGQLSLFHLPLGVYGPFIIPMPCKERMFRVDDSCSLHTLPDSPRERFLGAEPYT